MDAGSERRCVGRSRSESGIVSGVEFFRHELGQAELESLREALAGRFLTTGPLTARFEEALAQYLGVPFTVGVTSCTAAMHLSLLAWEIGPGDEVITTPLTFMATPNAILHAGATPVFADVDPATGNLDPAAVEAAITPRTKAILAVHLYGVLCDMRALRAIADRHGLVVFEDAAHCVEGVRDGVRPGMLSEAASFSFYATKNLTSGEGGALSVHEEDRRKLLYRLRLHGMTKDAHQRHRGQGSGVGYDMDVLGWKYNMDTIQAALLLPQLERLPEIWERRRRAWNWYLEELGDDEAVTLPSVPANCTSAYHLFSVWVDAQRRDATIQRLRAAQVGCTVNFVPVHQLTYYRERFGWPDGSFPAAESIGARTITLPFFPSLTRDEVARASEALRQALRAGS